MSHRCQNGEEMLTCELAVATELVVFSPGVCGVIPHLLPDDWMLEQNKRGKMPEEVC